MPEEKKNGKWQGVLFVLLVLIVIGFFIVRKNKSFSGEHEFYAYYQNIKGLQSSSPVQLNGVRVGKISDIDLNGGGKVKVTIRIKKGIEIPGGTVALLASGNILGDKLIRLEPGKGPGMPDLSVIPSSYDTSVMQVSVQVGPYLETAKLLLKSTDTSLKSFNLFFQTHLFTAVVHGLVSAEQTFYKYSQVTKGWSEKGYQIAGKIETLDTTSAHFASGSQNLGQSLDSVQAKTGRVANKPLKQDVQNLGTAINKLKASFSGLNNSTAGLGKLINNGQAYTNMSNNLDTLNRNMKQSYQQPTGFSIFGGKKKKK